MTRSRAWRPPRCATAKQAYRTQGRALDALQQIKRGNAQAAVPLDTYVPQGAYRCSCGAWHLTRRPGVKR